MMRKLAMAMVVSGALGSSFANALGLGEIKMNSALNQPLDAEVTLLNVGDLSKNEILPNLGSHEDFSRAGVERVFFLTGIKFDVELDGKGGAVLHLTTRQIVREPFLNFLIELHWPNGRLLREYTALLDPPMFSEAPAAPVQQAVTTMPAGPRSTISSHSEVTTPAVPAVKQSSVQSTSTAAKKEGTVRVKKNDTLWGIANKNRPDSSVTVRQTMLAIQQHNPDAFIKNNVNLLRAGQVLRIPDADEIRRISSHDASLEIVRQNEEWSGRKTIDVTQKYNNESTDSSTVVPDQGGTVKLVASDAESVDNSPAESAAGGAALDAESTSTGQNNEIGAEQGEASSIVNVDDLEQELQDLQRLMSLKQEQLALLQSTLVAKQEQDTRPVEILESEESAHAASTEAVMDPIDQAADTAGEVDAETVAAEAKNANTQAVTPVEVGVVNEQRPEQGIMDILTNNPLYIGVLIVVILGALILLGAISRRRREETEYPYDARQAINSAENDNLDLEEDFDNRLPEPTTFDEESEVLSDLHESGQLEVETATEDDKNTRKLLDEADIYIAYGRYERAIEILQPAVNDNPQNSELHLKLAEIFLASKDQAHFTQQEADLLAIGDTDAITKLETLKARYPESIIENDTGVLEDLDFELPEPSETPQTEPESDDEIEMPRVDLDKFSMASEADDFLVDDEDLQEANEESELEFSLDDAEEQPTVKADDMDFLLDTDESATKLELAKAYIDMADTEAAQDILNEVISEGSDSQKQEARKLLKNIE